MFSENIVNIDSMKQKYRVIDVVVQVIILILWLITIINKAGSKELITYIASGWFLLSLSIHAFISSEKYKDKYTKPLAAICCLLGGMIVCLLCPGLLYLLLYYAMYLMSILPIVALPIAALYTYVCFSEIRYLRKRPISLLK